MTTKVYTYGAKPPVVGIELVEDSIIHGHRYYNALIAMHRKRAEQISELRRRLIPGLDDAEAAVGAAEEALEDLRGAVRQRNAARRAKTATKEDQLAIKDAQASAKAARTLRKEMRARCTGAGAGELAAVIAGSHPAYAEAQRMAGALTIDRQPKEIDQIALAKVWAEFGPIVGGEFAAIAAAVLEYQTELARIWAEFSTESKIAYNDSPCWWGTKLHIAQSVERAVESSAETGSLPRFRRWEQVRFEPTAGEGGAFVGAGDGVAAVQLQGGMTVEELLSNTDSRLRMEFVNDGRRTSQRAARKVIFSLRLGSDGREPRWVRIPAYYHRGGELPADAKIMWATIIRRALAPRRQHDGSWRPWYEYSVQFTVRTSTSRPTAGSGSCGVNLGWRIKLKPEDADACEDDETVRPDGLRIAVAVGSDKEIHECVLPQHMLDGWRLCQELQRVRSLGFDRIRAVLADWLRGASEPPLALEVSAAELARLGSLADSSEDADRFRRGASALRAWSTNWIQRPKDIPEWLAKESQYIGQWKSNARLAQLLDRWQAQHFDRDEAAFAALSVWRQREAHLLQWEQSLRQRLDGQRKDIYRKFAARLATRYQTVAVEDTDYREIKKRRPAEDNTDDAAAREHMRHAAPGLLRQCLRNRAAATLKVSARNISRVHAACGASNAEDRRSHIMIVCPHCGVEYDQDVNAATNVLNASDDMMDENPGAARDPQPDTPGGVATNGKEKIGRWAKRKANRSRKVGETAQL